MLKIEPDILHKTITLEVEGKLTEDDYKQFLPALEEVLKRLEKVKFLILLHNFKGWDARALLEDVKFDTKYRDHCGRIAIVGEHVWEEWATRFGNLFFPDEMKYFPASEEEAARDWLKE